uniref:RNase H type-1 domain-containing protein n=1 Tax=Colletotrichum fructicola (strain Nara gc5) TaxID=1213859 RepID=L2FUC8_COLFN
MTSNEVSRESSQQKREVASRSPRFYVQFDCGLSIRCKPTPTRFHGDLWVEPRERAMAAIPEHDQPTPRALNLFTDSSFPGKESWGSGPSGHSTLDNPAGATCPDFLVAELYALALGLETALYLSRAVPDLRQVNIFTDCKDAIRSLMRADASDDDPLVQRAVAASAKLEAKGVRTAVRWCPGHVGVEGNERADQLAKAVRRCSTRKGAVPTEMPDKMKEYRVTVNDHELRSFNGRSSPPSRSPSPQPAPSLSQGPMIGSYNEHGLWVPSSVLTPINPGHPSPFRPPTPPGLDLFPAYQAAMSLTWPQAYYQQPPMQTHGLTYPPGLMPQAGAMVYA